MRRAHPGLGDGQTRTRDVRLMPKMGTTMESRITPDDLTQFTGTDNYYRHASVRGVLYTDGARFLADRAGAYWLLDEIAFAQRHRRVAAEAFQNWRLLIERAKGVGSLTCDDGNGAIVYRKRIPYTDFPLPEVALFFVDGVIMLPGEY